MAKKSAAAKAAAKAANGGDDGTQTAAVSESGNVGEEPAQIQTEEERKAAERKAAAERARKLVSSWRVRKCVILIHIFPAACQTEEGRSSGNCDR